MSNPDVAQGKVRPGLKVGRSNEFTLIMPLKPGGAERLRKKMGADKFPGGWALDRIGTVHDLRYLIFDNDTGSYLRPLLMVIGTHTSMTLRR